jgi:hypothetical protein
MRYQYLLTLIGASAVSLSAAAAPASGDVNPAITSVHVAADSGYRMNAADFDRLRGTYALDDGRLLTVSTEHRKLYANVGGARTEIVPVRANVFASRDDSLRVAFDDKGWNTEVKVSTLAAR